MDLKALKNPYVIVGGVAVVLAVVLIGKGGSAGTVDDPVNALTSAQMASNALGVDYSEKMAALAADTTQHQIDATAQVQNQLLSMLGGMFNVSTQAQSQNAAVSAGVTNSIVQANTSLLKEYSDNATRLATSWVSADVSKAGFAAQTQQTQITADANYRTATGVASINAGANTLNAVLNAATSLMKGIPVKAS